MYEVDRSGDHQVSAASGTGGSAPVYQNRRL